MRKIILVLLLALGLASCNFKEEITFKKDGSGELMVTYDMSTMMTEIKKMGMDDKKEDESEKKTKEKIDSVIYFKEIYKAKKDSIAKLSKVEQEKLEALKDMKMKMLVDEETGVFEFGFGFDFKNTDELHKSIDLLEEAKRMNSKNNPQYDKMNSSAISKSTSTSLEQFEFEYNGKSFSRTYKGDLSKSKEDLEKVNSEIEQMGKMKGLFEAMTYTMVYNFPEKVKSVSNKNAKIINGGKTVKFEVNLMDMIKNPESINLNVKLK